MRECQIEWHSPATVITPAPPLGDSPHPPVTQHNPLGEGCAHTGWGGVALGKADIKGIQKVSTLQLA